jgi:hypothetical protein
MILLTYVIPLIIAKIIDQLYVTVVLNLLMISSHHLIPAQNHSCSSSNAEDSLNCNVKNERNLNVLSLNCCGIKLRLQYPDFCELIKKNDIICLQETKTDDIDKIELKRYTFKMKNRKKNW